MAFSIIDQLWQNNALTGLPQSTLHKLSALFTHFRRHPERCRFSQTWEICVDLLKQLNDFVLIVDGMDECSFDECEDGQTPVEALEALLESTDGKVAIFCRPSFPLKIGTDESSRPNEIRLTTEKTRDDFGEMCEFESQKLKWDPGLRSKAKEMIILRAEGSFLSAKLRFEELSKLRVHKDIHLAMGATLPDTVQEYYQRGLNRLVDEAPGKDTEACRHILLVLLGTRRLLTLNELSSATGLIPALTGPLIPQWLYPIVSWDRGIPVLAHATVRDFLSAADYASKAPPELRFAPDEPNSFMAERCLECLLDEKFGDPDRIARRLRARFGLEKIAEDPVCGFYAYAAANWALHLIQIKKPSRELVELAGKFLSALQFTYWAEYVFIDFGDFQAIRATQTQLLNWSNQLEKDEQQVLGLEGYYEVPYKRLNQLYESRKEDDRTLPWLPLMQLGFYYFDIGRIHDMQKVRTYVADGLCKLLGRKNPLTLRARSEAAFALLNRGDLSKARKTWTNVAADQMDTVPEEDRSELYRTLFYKGMAEYLMNDYTTALRTLAYVSAKFLGSKGPTSNPFLVAELWYAQVNATRGELEQASTTMEDIRQKREEKYGSSDGSATLTLTFLSDVYRKLGEQGKAIKYLEEALKQRKRLWAITHPLVIDASLRLAITYRDFDLDDDAWDLIDEVEQKGRLEEEDKFYELCQARHLKGLLQFGDGNTDEAILILQRLIIDTDPNKVIRPLHWIRTDLADMLRHRNHPGDGGTASMLFDGVIVAQESRAQQDAHRGSVGEPDPPQQLELAEKALRLCRSESLSKAQKLLEDEGFRWKSERSLWLIAGMPAADTTVMKPPRGLGDRSSASPLISDSSDTEA